MNYFKENLQGVWPAMFTPVTKNGKVSNSQLEKLIEMLIKEGTDGLYILGSTGQGFLFSEQERKEITEQVVQIVNKRVPIIVQVGAINTEECIRLAKHAALAGVDAISAVGPIYYAPSGNMAFEHYCKIAHATDLPFIPYQIGHATNKTLVEKLLGIPNIIGMKLTTLNLLEISSVYRQTKGSWQLFSGADELICQAALCGTAGAIGSTYNVLPGTFKKVREKFLAGEVQMANEFMLAFQNTIEDILPVIWSFYRRAMQLKHNIDIGDPKPPLLAHTLKWNDNEVMQMVSDLEEIVNKHLEPTIINS
ncbi:MAG TPA: dihydrodipicolinate synthase family protein [Flavisolibacter sp.]|jgi:N-acetylneuraminate lyase|nr:dihydrodipicolinate synthase family protein [Flavisolibacter sp.]